MTLAAFWKRTHKYVPPGVRHIQVKTYKNDKEITEWATVGVFNLCALYQHEAQQGRRIIHITTNHKLAPTCQHCVDSWRMVWGAT